MKINNEERLYFVIGALIDSINQLPKIEKTFIKNRLNEKMRRTDKEFKATLEHTVNALQ